MKLSYLSCLTCTLLAACGVDPGGPAPGGENIGALPAGGAPKSVTTRELTSANFTSGQTSFFEWTQGSPTVSMFGDSTGPCAVVQVGGHFEGDGEEVYLYDSSGTWSLTGTSGQTGVYAWAGCTQWSSFNGPVQWYVWSTTPAGVSATTKNGSIWFGTTDLWGNNAFCFMQGMSGHFSDSATWVSIYQSPVPTGSWYLQAQEDFGPGIWTIRGYAGCVALTPINPLSLTTQFSVSIGGSNYVNLPDTNTAFCALSSVGGNLRTSTAQAGISVSGTSQQLFVAGSSPLYASAQCMYFAQ
jgi:hypothetical protein